MTIYVHKAVLGDDYRLLNTYRAMPSPSKGVQAYLGVEAEVET